MVFNSRGHRPARRGPVRGGIDHAGRSAAGRRVHLHVVFPGPPPQPDRRPHRRTTALHRLHLTLVHRAADPVSTCIAVVWYASHGRCWLGPQPCVRAWRQACRSTGSDPPTWTGRPTRTTCPDPRPGIRRGGTTGDLAEFGIPWGERKRHGSPAGSGRTCVAGRRRRPPAHQGIHRRCGSHRTSGSPDPQRPVRGRPTRPAPQPAPGGTVPSRG